MEGLANLIPKWLYEWLKIYIIPFLKIEMRNILQAMLQGIGDAFLFLSIPLTISLGSQAILNTRYHMTPAQQEQVSMWSGVSSIIAYTEDVPPVVPLVLWYKEAGLRAENPGNCEGIMGLYSAVRSGEIPCFPPGPIGAWEIAHQLQLGARTFKSYCPEVSYTTTDPGTLKRCYLYYNAGPASRMNPNNSAYVMNNYDAGHQNMVLTDIKGRSYRLQASGAWPVHLAMQAQLAQDSEPLAPLAIMAPVILGQELLDKLWVSQTEITISSPGLASVSRACGAARVDDCFIMPHTQGNVELRPSISPLQAPITQGGKLKCGLLPGTDLTVEEKSAILSPISGTLSHYMDKDGHLAIQIENEEWSVWVTGLRSYTKPEGEVQVGESIGVIGGANSMTPGIHYAVYDKIEAGFVDPMSFMPSGSCPPVG